MSMFDKPAGPGALDPAASPFQPGTGTIPPVLGGRELETARYGGILRRLKAGRSVTPEFLEGPRGVGKTVLLAMLAQEATDREIVTVEFELRGDGDASSALLSPLVDAIQRVAPLRQLKTLADRLLAVRIGPAEVALADQSDVDATVAGLVTDLGTAADDVGRAVLLTVDETHENPAVAASLVQGLHRALQHQNAITAILAGLPGTSRQVAGIVTYAERMQVVELGLLEPAGVADAIRQPLAEHDLLVDDEVITAVTDASGGYPYFVQLWGQALWEAATDPHRITPETAQLAAVAVDDAVDRFFARRWDLLTPTQQVYVAALAGHGGQASSRALAEALGRRVTAASNLRDSLLKAGIVYAPSRGQVAFTVPPMASWLQQG